jgi:hypothetical protein
VIFRRRRRLTTREVKRILAAQGQVTAPVHISKPLAEIEAILREADRRNHQR